MNKNEIDNNTIFMMLRGSQAYGTNIEGSDEDFGGVYMPNKDCMYGIDLTEQDDRWVDANGETLDKVVYSFNKALTLLTSNNPNMMDFLCAPDRVVLKKSPIWEKVQDNADLSSVKKPKTHFLVMHYLN